MEIELRKLAESVAYRTFAQLGPQCKPGSRTKARAASRRLRNLDRWRLDRRGPGRRAGSKTRKTNTQIQKNLEERKSKILAAIGSLYARNPEKVTRRAVAENLGIDRKTLSNWLREGGLKFEDLFAEYEGKHKFVLN